MFGVKKLLIAVVCSLGTAIGLWAESPMGLSEEFVQNPKAYLLQKIVSGKPIKYFIRLDSEGLPATPNTDLDTKLTRSVAMRTAIVSSVNSWFENAKRAIETSDHPEQFKHDIWPIVSRRVVMQEVPRKEDADLTIWFTNIKTIHAECYDDSEGCFVDEEMLAIVPYLEYDRDAVGWGSEHVLIHEMGHAMGLADQYEGADNASAVYSTSHRISSIYKKTSGISILGDSEQLGCDDADGLVYALDYLANYQLPKDKYSRRVREGWGSFCGDGTIFQNLKVLDKPSYLSNGKLYRYEHTGDISSQETINPFFFKGKKIEYIREVQLDEKLHPFVYIFDPQTDTSFIGILDMNDEEPALVVGVMDEQTDKFEALGHYKIERKHDPLEDYWELPYGADMMTVYPKKDMCGEILAGMKDGVFKFTWIDIGESPKPQLRMYYLRAPEANYSIEQENNPLARHLNEIGISGFWEDNSWQHRVTDLKAQRDILRLEGNKISFENAKDVAYFAAKYRMSEADFKQNAAHFCRRATVDMIAGLDVEEREELCGFVLELEDFYQEVVSKQQSTK